MSRLGENVWRTIDFRVIAATNRDLLELVARGAFGADLYERLAILTIELPPLRERAEDLPALVEHMMARFYDDEASAAAPPARGAGSTGMPRVTSVTPAALEALAAYPWPGNVRELRNAVYQALVRKRAGDELLPADLPPRVLRGARDAGPAGATAAPREIVDPAAIAARIDAGRMNLRGEVEKLEREALREALARTGGNASRAATLLGEVGRGASTDPGGTVRAMMRRLGLTDAAAGGRGAGETRR